MHKNKIKTLMIMMLFCVITLSFNNIIYAGGRGGSFGSETDSVGTISDIFSDAKDFIEAGESVDAKIDTTALKETSTFIFRLLYSIGMVVAVAVGIVLGIQFMVAGAEDKAKIKETLIAYVVGCVVLFGAYPIWKLVINIVSEVTTI